jgi:hypothetical protein
MHIFFTIERRWSGKRYKKNEHSSDSRAKEIFLHAIVVTRAIGLLALV